MLKEGRSSQRPSKEVLFTLRPECAVGDFYMMPGQSESTGAEAQKWEELSHRGERGPVGLELSERQGGMIPKSGGPDPQGCPGLMEELVFPEWLHWEVSKV